MDGSKHPYQQQSIGFKGALTHGKEKIHPTQNEMNKSSERQASLTSNEGRRRSESHYAPVARTTSSGAERRLGCNGCCGWIWVAACSWRRTGWWCLYS
ncbi:hypothetical protein PR202_ga03944 [Eleusine coracana subsp. coracana]|uniref:Uncharacterized protein n=1 Tax=Eleusine coracana subsp. coracana TaxID=191504 RepID=A0AAV5BP06_ELECO|nr:hypothetical protein PR202_ga03944 [Eleusine coracana subsp. coracana]